VLILKVVKASCFDALLEVFILKVFAVGAAGINKKNANLEIGVPGVEPHDFSN
jgi:hypothetical protein